MSKFKWIGVTPLASCNKKYRKNLEIGKTYQFYSGYDIKINPEFSEITSVKHPKKEVPNIYHLKNGIDLNFSAVVGKNGTGKSTIIELLYYTIYAISSEKRIGEKRVLKTELDSLLEQMDEAKDYYNWLKNCREVKSKLDNGEELNEFESGVLNDDYKDPFLIALEIQKKYKTTVNEKKVTDSISFIHEVQSDLHNNVIRLLHATIREQEEWEADFRNSFACSILYESDGIVKEISYRNAKFCYSEFNPDRTEKIQNVNEFDFSQFFYNVSLNFSHHSLNSNTIGSWINKLFHKNDAYYTPIVINPMRNDGNFKINHELKLSKERLMANLLYDIVRDKKSYILGKYRISKFIFLPKILSGLPAFDFTEKFISELQSSTLFKQKLKISKLDDKIEYWDFAIGYLERKINRIDKNYGDLIYDKPLPFQSRKVKLDEFLLEDKSHITKKIRQVINFLMITYEKKNRHFWKIPENTVRIDLSESRMKEWLNLFGMDLKKLSPSELIEIGLPGFFNIDFLLEDNRGNEIEFSKLSSGEQQMILNTNSILYHLYNLESVHFNTTSNHGDLLKRLAYNDVNVILDEVELYYHPEMQRRLVSDLIKNLDRLKPGNGIQSINICILTHSPFILSDIPSANVLTLPQDTSRSNNETLGANIHEMLLGSFFMDSVTGEFVRERIFEILKFYGKVKDTNTTSQLKKLQRKYNLNREKYHYIVKNIGEDVIKSVLSNHLEFIDEKLGHEKN